MKKVPSTGIELPIPVIPNIHKLVYEAVLSSPEKLRMGEWHSQCGTAHCRAGWIVAIAGDQGTDLEESLGTAHAAALICQASGHPVQIRRFYFDSRVEALADMKRMAVLP